MFGSIKDFEPVVEGIVKVCTGPPDSYLREPPASAPSKDRKVVSRHEPKTNH